MLLARSPGCEYVMAVTGTTSLAINVLVCFVFLAGTPLVPSARGDNLTQRCKTDLYIVTYLSYPTLEPVILQQAREDGPHIAPAIRLAVDQINNRTDILPYYSLKLVESFDGCNVAPTTYLGIVESMYYFSARQVLPIAGIGPRCSDSALSAARMSLNRLALPFFHLGMIPKLSEYSYTLGVVGSLSATVDALVELMEYNEWTKISILYKGTDTDHFTLYEELGSKMSQSYDILVSLPVTTTYFPLEEVRDSLTRVIFAFVDREILQILMCLAFHEDIMFPTYQWVFFSQFVNADVMDERYTLNGKDYVCSEMDILHALNSSVTVYMNLEPESNETVLVSNDAYSEYLEKVKRYSGADYMRTVWANPAYDAVWSLALALNTTSAEIEHNTTINNDHIERIVYNIYNQDSFVGASGNISFQNGTGYAGRSFGICQYSDGQCEYVGCYENGILEFQGTPKFIDSDFETSQIKVPFPYAIVTLVVTAIPLVLTIFTQLIGILYRDLPVIKGSSHKLNQFAYFGAYIITAGVAVVTINYLFEFESRVHAILCVATTWTLSVGLCLVLATMCVKTWRLYRIHTASSQLKSIKNPTLLTDAVLSLGIVCLTLVVVVSSVSYTVLDWPVWAVTYSELNEENPPINYTYRECQTKYDGFWVIFIYGYFNFIIIFSFVVAFLSRKMQQRGIHSTNVLILAYFQIFLVAISVTVYFSSLYFNFLFGTYVFQILIFNGYLYTYVGVLFLPPVLLLLKLKCSKQTNPLLSPTPPSKRRSFAGRFSSYSHTYSM